MWHQLKMGCTESLHYLWQRMGRQKLVTPDDTHTVLLRCLSTLQMTAIGLGSTIGVGIYVLLGVAIKDYAGPGVILSFVFAAFVTLANALIYAEFGSYIPHTGAAYTYIFCSVNELAAFAAGWMALFAVVCSGAVGARAWSGLIDSLFNNTIQSFFDDKIGRIDLGPPFARSLDWIAFAYYLIITIVVSCNIRFSSVVNTVLAIITVGVLIFVTGSGFILGDVKKIADPEEGGFLPYGLGGVIVGASAGFYAFSGFDSICISAEEAKNPSKSVPRAILLELAIVTVVYCGAAIGTLCLIPYSKIDVRAPIPSAFAYHGIIWGQYIVTIGPIFAITNMNVLNLYTVSRLAYRMAEDGVFFEKFSYVNPRTKVPMLGVIVFGILMSVISLVLELKNLVSFTVLCMLFQYIILGPALIALRIHDKEQSAPSLKDNCQRQKPTADNFCILGEIIVPPNTFPFEERHDQFIDTEGISHQEAYDTDGDLGSGLNLRDPLACENSGVSTVRFLQDNSLPTTALQSDRSTQSEHRLLQGETEYSARSKNVGLLHPDGCEPGELKQLKKNVSKHLEPLLLDDAQYSTNSSSQLSEKGCFKGSMNEFFKLLTSKLSITLLVVCLCGLAFQLGLGWGDVKNAKTVSVATVIFLIVLSVFFCEVLRARCEPGHHDGFKVPLVPYVPALSCFMNLLLLVSAVDSLGLLESAVLVCIGLIAYVVMVFMQKHAKSAALQRSTSDATYSLLSNEDGGEDESENEL